MLNTITAYEMQKLMKLLPEKTRRLLKESVEL